MKTIIVFTISIIFGLIIAKQNLFWSGLNPKITNYIYVSLLVLLILAGFIIYKETQNRNRLIQIGIILTSLVLSLLIANRDKKPET